MTRKCREYFAAGVRLVWLVDPATRAARVYSGATAFELLGADGTLDGAEVLSGFAIALRDLFAELHRHAGSSIDTP